MEDVNLLSSAAVLRAIFDEKKDIYDVLKEFIMSSINSRNLKSFNSTELLQFIEEDFNFRLPEAIVKSCLKKRLVKEQLLTRQYGSYNTTSLSTNNTQFQEDFERSRCEYDDVITKLNAFCSKSGLKDINLRELEDCFERSLTRPDLSNKYSQCIAKFIVAFQHESGFTEKLRKIEEGLILYTGIRYSPDLSTLGCWKGSLTVFLDTEHLFNAVGYNGSLYKTLFDDFYNLTNEVNRSKKSGKIELKYFEETDREIESFFYSAINIVEKKASIDPSKTAMKNICNGCTSRSDVITKKAIFQDKLSKLKITKESNTDYYSNSKTNVESTSILESLCDELKETTVSEEQVSSVLKVFTKVNYLRNGSSKLSIDKVACIFLTESWLPQRIAFSDHVFDGNGSIPYATNIEFLTEKLWFKLHKGFGGSAQIPASFDPVIRAKLTLSNEVCKAISNIYRSLKDDFDLGNVSTETVARIHYEINKAPSKPEDISIDSISMSEAFLNDDYIEKVICEKNHLELEVIEGRKAKEELRKMKIREEKSRRIKYRNGANAVYLLSIIFFITLCSLPIAAAFYVATQSDTALSIFMAVFAIGCVIIPFWKKGDINKICHRWTKNYYRNAIRKYTQP
ncbi:hypothetical protein [Pseudoalteromonas byunsanensis]|uniref:Uncharacterized protein n=1 Tax=Pseudoalteromonas byunsanensis TaxID=327939 RepID=A0A1S1NAE0_9GAMM|nr:hypothetical protein [Pseudoalteromonas byunsanensis]OHU96394.1 hypothetical protein BIW53_07590 [Pseudoalteromonas byunsanensis]